MSKEMEELVADLVAEQDYLDGQLQGIDEALWDTPSPAEGWLLRDCIAHLAEVDTTAAIIAETGEYPAREPRVSNSLLTPMMQQSRTESIEALVAYWRDARKRLAAAVAPMESKARLPWAGKEMSVRSFTTARLMEAWSHGLDAIDAAGREHIDSDRLIHVAQIGYMTRGFGYQTRGMEPNNEPLRLELESPSGALWTWGPEDAPLRITGYAGDFCRVVTQRINYQDTYLETVGDGAEEFLRIAQAFAGPPGAGRQPQGKRPRR